MGSTEDAQAERALGLVLARAHSMTQSASRRLRENGLTPAQYQVLLLVDREPGLVQQRVGDRFGVTRANVSMLVSHLERRGWLWRSPRGAANQLELTGEGRVLVRRLIPDQQRWTRDQFSGLDAAEVTELIRLLEKLDHVDPNTKSTSDPTVRPDR